MKFILLIPEYIKYLIIILCCFCIINKSFAQADNIYLDGDNYIRLDNPAFPSTLEWTDASKERITGSAEQFPVKTYWFSHNGKSYIVINLTSGKSDIYIELGANKNTYHFPADFAYPETQGAYNNFELYVANASGILQKLSVTKKSQLSVKVLQLDSLHVKLSFSGTIIAYTNPGGESELEIGDPTPPMTISGKISLSKKNTGLAHLPDSYPGCDNTIYNEFSPDYSDGQYCTPTECEQSFYKKTFTTLSNALSPAIKYLGSQDWNISSAPKYKPLEHRLRNDMNNFFKTNPLTGIDYDLDINANPMKGAYHEYLQKTISLAQQLGQGDPKKIKELETLQKEEPRTFKLRLQVVYNQPVQSNYSLDLSHAQVKKINDDLFLIENVENTSNYTFHDDGGAYLFIGKWTEPQFNNGYIVCSPVFNPGAKKLSIQAMYIRIGCGNELAETLLKYINLTKLQQILDTTP